MAYVHVKRLPNTKVVAIFICVKLNGLDNSSASSVNKCVGLSIL